MSNPFDDNTTARPLALGVDASFKEMTWVTATFDARQAETIAQRLELDPTIAKLLSIRDQTLDTARSFLTPELRVLMPNPSVLKGMDKATARIVSAIENKEQIVIFGDYDVDGATSVALWTRFLRCFGLDPKVYIPNRLTEGYGPSAEAMREVRQQGSTLCLMVDCGTTAFEPLDAAKEVGLDVIVMDHHQAEARLPASVAMVNPKRLDDESGLDDLCAAGVVFMVLVAVNREIKNHPTLARKINLLAWLDMVAVATVCDVVPLSGLNRAFVRQGLKVMANRGNMGFNALVDICNIDKKPDTYHAGFIFGPRINAAGRLGQSSLGHRLLSTEDVGEARELAMKLDSLNADRRTIEAEILDEAMMQAKRKHERGDAVLVLAGEKWHSGVTGIIAARVKEKFSKPALVIAWEDKDGVVLGKGSGRSVKGIDLGNLIVNARLREILVSGGGHAMAAGLSVAPDKIDELASFLNEQANKVDTSANKLLDIDLVLSVSGANVELVEMIDQLEPFGAGNPEPRIALNKAKILYASAMGDNHLRLTLGDEANSSTRLRAAAFRCLDTDMGQNLLNGQGQNFHLAGHLRFDQWMSNKSGEPAVQFILEDAASISS